MPCISNNPIGAILGKQDIDNTGHVIFKYICSYQQFLLFALKIMEDNIT